MTNFTEETSLYEILFRVSPDRSWSAQYQTLTEVKRDGVVISANVSDAAPLSSEDSDAISIVAQLISEDSLRLMSENASLRNQIYSCGDIILQNQQEIEDLRARIAELESPVDLHHGS